VTGIRAQWSLGAAGPLLAREEREAGNWRDRGLCTEVDSELFYPERGSPAAAAKRICADCSVRSQCLDFALDSGEAWGIWGGMSRDERRDESRRRRGLKPLRQPAAAAIATVPAAGGLKRCSRCREDKERDDFNRHAGAADGLSAWCRECKSQTRRPPARQAA
jgi:WhiB family redox-sensing transcriptional regulator